MITKIKQSILGLITLLFVAVAVPPVAVGAVDDNAGGEAAASDPCRSGVTIFPRWYDNGLCENGAVKSPGDMDGADTGEKFSKWASILALNIVSILLYAVGYVSLGFIIYGGFKYMTSGDNSSGVAAAQKTIQNAIIGLVLSIMSVAIVTFVAGAIGG